MNATLTSRPAFDPAYLRRRGSPVAVEVLVCGSADRGDDGAPLAAVGRLRASLPADVIMRVVGQLDIDDLLSIHKDAGVVIVDAATGIDPGSVVELPLSGLIDRQVDIQPRSSHALAIREVIGLAEMIRGRPLRGRIVAIGGLQFGLGRPISRRVATRLAALSLAVLDAVEGVRPAGDPAPGGA